MDVVDGGGNLSYKLRNKLIELGVELKEIETLCLENFIKTEHNAAQFAAVSFRSLYT